VELEPATASSGGGRKGALAVGYALADAYLFGVPICAVAIWGSALVAFVGGAVLWTLANIAACTWVDRHWATFAAGSGQKIEAKLQKARSSSVMSHAVGWIERGSAFWFGFAAVLINAFWVVAIARVLTGSPVGQRRILVASAAYALVWAGFFALIGYAAAAAGI
jgi:hypothetical protein